MRAGAKVAVDAAGVAVMRLCCVYTVRCSYALYQRLLSMLEQEACTVGESVFTDEVALLALHARAGYDANIGKALGSQRRYGFRNVPM